jgi:RNA polymerase sigma-70 factor (ECF subfamily)
MRHDLSSEAIRLARLFLELLPDPEAEGLLALMRLHESRRSARTTPDGEMILLEDQDRSLWNRELIAEGIRLVRHAFASRGLGPYTVQAAISALHAEAPNSATTDCSEIVALYDLLLRIDPSPVVELNRAVAIAMRDGPAAGLSEIEGLLAKGELDNCPLAHSAKAELCRRVGQMDKAKASFERALALTSQEQQRRFLERQLAEIK